VLEHRPGHAIKKGLFPMTNINIDATALKHLAAYWLKAELHGEEAAREGYFQPATEHAAPRAAARIAKMHRLKPAAFGDDLSPIFESGFDAGFAVALALIQNPIDSPMPRWEEDLHLSYSGLHDTSKEWAKEQAEAMLPPTMDPKERSSRDRLN
jgi:hypothetical protein